MEVSSGMKTALGITMSCELAACGGGSPDNSDPLDQPEIPIAPAPPATMTADWPPSPVMSPPTACAGPLMGSHATYNVGPGQPLAELTDVPWLQLQAGDVVNIHHRKLPYRTKFGLRATNTSALNLRGRNLVPAVWSASGPGNGMVNTIAANLLLTAQYREGVGIVPRVAMGGALDLGAFERP